MALTPHEFAIADEPTSRAMGLPGREHAILFCTDEAGERWTCVGDDVE
jgi:hypothetical protein